MKRSSSVRLSLMGAAAVTSLAACDSSPTASSVAFTSIAECVAANYSESQCRSAYDAALTAHADKAPRFKTRDECLRGVDVDNCTETAVRNPDGTFSQVFLPLMAGYMLGNALAPRQQPSGPSSGGGYAGGGRWGGYTSSTPLYRSRDYPANYRDSGNLTNSRPPGATVSRPPNVNTTTIARSGFGSTSRYFGGGSS
ncbi:DUF1190 domain-containing protein [Chelatococcus reniformis]|uniref:DUF1190 domain-containing protein n=1 Tax=Chelatococcus reniformis TaxID=1494448 RepID=A0A916UJK0_9HYPH|nr:DUF1190 domain-containing protein [Chelatococcus reniformis]GGC74959.1 hypothetical protein GCM10010994_36750 [Chelatococcus reniformis]